MDFLEENQLNSYQSQPSSPKQSNGNDKSIYNDFLSKSPSSILDTCDLVSPDERMNDIFHTKNSAKVIVSSEAMIEKNITSKSEIETNNWSRTEIFKFFDLYKKYYKDFQAISINMNSRSKDQVRQFYYRLVTKITTMLQKYGCISEELRIKEKNYIHRAILSYYNVLKSVKPNNKRYMNPKFFSKALIKKMKYCKASLQSTSLIQQKTNNTNTITRNRKDNSKQNNTSHAFIQNDIVSFIIPTVSESSQKQTNQPISQLPSQQQQQQQQIEGNTTASSVCFRATIQLIPFDNQTSTYMEQCLYNPLLEITCGSNKPISTVTNHLLKKWNRLNGYVFTIMNENAKELSNFDNLLNTLPYHNNVIRLYYRWTIPATYNKCVNKHCAIQNKPIKRIKPTLVANYLNSDNQRNVIGFIQAPTVFSLPYVSMDICAPISMVNNNDSLLQSSLNLYVEDDLLTIPSINRTSINPDSFCI